MKSIHTEKIHGGTMWSKVIGRGKTLRLTDIDGRANVGMLLYNALEKEERYNMPDTLKGQHIFYLTTPFCVHSDMGRLFCSITADTAGWHDTVCGCSDEDLVKKKYGTKPYQEAHNDCYRDARRAFLIELAKWGMGKRDLVPNLNWFSKVVSDEEGKLSYVPGASKPGSYVDLRFEMDTLVVLNTCQHPLDPNPNYEPGDVNLEVFKTEAPTAQDSCFQSRPENLRAFENTETYHKLRF
jgi:urea carboxylase-associated protein 2